MNVPNQQLVEMITLAVAFGLAWRFIRKLFSK